MALFRGSCSSLRLFFSVTFSKSCSSASSNYVRFASTAVSPNPSTSSRDRANQWDVFVAPILQRTPLIGPELNWLERRLKDFLTKVEVVDSLHSDHEMRHFEDLRRAERIASGVNVEEKDLEEAAKQTAQDFEESSVAEAKQFHKASRVTKADLTNNVRSIDRSLDKHLYLVQKRSLGSGSSQWLLPQELFQPNLDRSLRATLERSISGMFPAISTTTTGNANTTVPSVHVKYLGNCPAGYYSYRYPKAVSEQKDGALGARIFFFKVNLDQNFDAKHGALKGQFGERVLAPQSSSAPEYGWFTRTELSKQLPERYWNSLAKLIYPDELVDLEALMQQKKRKFARLSTRLQKLESKVATG